MEIYSMRGECLPQLIIDSAGNVSHFIQFGDAIYQSVPSSNKIIIYEMSSGAITGEIRHDEMGKPWGICEVADEAFVACHGTIMRFNLEDPSRTIKKFVTTDYRLSGICCLQSHIYAASYDFKQHSHIMAFNMKGEEVMRYATIFKRNSGIRDMCVKSEDEIVVAAGAEGAVTFQITFED